jgi:Peptidase family M28
VGRGRTRDQALGVLALALGAAEANPRLQPLTRLLGRRRSANVIGAVEPREPARRTVCVVSHLDSSRSGLLFHPRLAPRLRTVIGALTAALTIRGIALIARGRPAFLRLLGRAAAAPVAAGLALLAEREIRGEDVPGANDNASGVAVAATLCDELARRPLAGTRVVFLATGCEESGTVGMRAFLEAHDTRDWLFLNLDGVGAPATLRYLPREGVGRTWAADSGLLAVAEGLARRRPELGLARAERLVGLTYDATQVLSQGGRAMTLSAQDDTIPNYHTPSDVAENLDPGVLARAQEVVRELLLALDRGEADRPGT